MKLIERRSGRLMRLSLADDGVKLGVEEVREGFISALHVIQVLIPFIEEEEAVEALLTSLQLILGILTTSHL